MAQEINHDLICPHCGYGPNDEELCQICGKLIDDDIPAQKISQRDFFGKLFFGMQKKGFHGIDGDDGLSEDPWSDPGWSTLTGNLFNHDGD